MNDMDGDGMYYVPYKTVNECWNDTIQISDSEIEKLSFLELINKMTRVFAEKLRRHKLADGNEKWIKDYVLDSIQGA